MSFESLLMISFNSFLVIPSFCPSAVTDFHYQIDLQFAVISLSGHVISSDGPSM